MIVVLQKADDVDNGNTETNPENQDEQRHQTFELEVLLAYILEDQHI